MNVVYLLLGSNKGDRKKYLLLVQYFILHNIGIILKKSAIYETSPWGKINQANFLNQVLQVQTDQSPFQLLKQLQKIEKRLGRKNKGNNAARTIDIDILFFNSAIIEAKNLTVPHSKLHLRKFTLIPLKELNASFIHPVLKKSIGDLEKECEDNLKVSIFAQ